MRAKGKIGIVTARHLFHVTDESSLDGIARQGLRAKSYWAEHIGVSVYYRECVADEGGNPVVLVADLAQLGAIEPDWPGIEEPITTALGVAEAELRQAWDVSSRDAEACLRIFGTTRCVSIVDPSVLFVEGPSGELEPLVEYLRQSAKDAPPRLG